MFHSPCYNYPSGDYDVEVGEIFITKIHDTTGNQANMFPYLGAIHGPEENVFGNPNSPYQFFKGHIFEIMVFDPSYDDQNILSENDLSILRDYFYNKYGIDMTMI